MSDYQEELITYVMCNSEKTRRQAITYCEENLIRWGEM